MFAYSWLLFYPQVSRVLSHFQRKNFLFQVVDIKSGAIPGLIRLYDTAIYRGCVVGAVVLSGRSVCSPNAVYKRSFIAWQHGEVIIFNFFFASSLCSQGHPPTFYGFAYGNSTYLFALHQNSVFNGRKNYTRSEQIGPFETRKQTTLKHHQTNRLPQQSEVFEREERLCIARILLEACKSLQKRIFRF